MKIEGDACNIKNKNDNDSYKLLEQQLFLKNFISPYTPYKNILIFHGTGVGKTNIK